MVENYGQDNDLQRRFVFEYIYDNKPNHQLFFNNTVKSLVKSAYDKGLQHSLVLYEPSSQNYYFDFLGLLENQQKSLDKCQLYHSLKYVIELAHPSSDTNSTVQVSMVAIRHGEIIDMFNQGKPLESPLGYTLDKVEQIESFFSFASGLLTQIDDIEHLCVSIYYQNRISASGKHVESKYIRKSDI